MKTVTIKMDIQTGNRQPIDWKAFEPFDGCPLVITRPVAPGSDDLKPAKSEWRVTHAPTGMLLGGKYFKTRDSAVDFINRCCPLDPAWQGTDTSTRQRCYELYKAAVNTP